MQKISEAFILDDDMVDGDLGDGKDIRAARRSTGKKSQSFGRLSEVLLPRAELLRRSSQAGETAWILGQKTAKTHPGAGWRVSRCGSLDDPSKDELKGRLQEASEVIDVLCSELDVAHRYLEGKYQALKILEGKAILDKATSHTKSLLQKSDQRAKALEKEVNSLQWELSFSQVQMKKSEQSWEQKYNGILSENKTLTDDLQERESEVQLLRAENSAVSRQCLELLSMLNVREQRVYLGTRPQYSPERDASVLELDAQRSRREEALMVADAFRIAFEQQLRKRSDHFLLQAETNILKSNHCKAEGVNRSPLMSVSQRLRRLLPSSVELETPDDLLESLYRLLDLLNDKDEALAHQRKVSLMLAHSADELQRQLHLDSPCQASDPSESSVPSQQPRDPSRDQSRSQQRAESPESNRREEQQVATKDEKCVLSH